MSSITITEKFKNVDSGPKNSLFTLFWAGQEVFQKKTLVTFLYLLNPYFVQNVKKKEENKS